MNFRTSGQKIKIFSKTKNLGLDEKLTIKNHLDKEKFKLNRANCLLIKVRYYVKPFVATHNRVYYAIFDAHLRYGCQIWGQTESKAVKIF